MFVVGHEITFFDSFLLAFHNTSSEHDVDEHVENIETTDDVNKPENTLPKTLEELPHVEVRFYHMFALLFLLVVILNNNCLN